MIADHHVLQTVSAVFSRCMISSDDVRRALRSFSAGSSAGPDGLTPQHLLDLLTGTTDDSLEQAIVDWVNVMLAGSFSGGLHTEAASSEVRQQPRDRDSKLQPLQLGAGVKGGAEATVHAARRFVQDLPTDHAVVKLDFSNAFNSVRRDVIAYLTRLQQKRQKSIAWYTCSILVRSREGAQQWDPLRSLEFCEAIHPLLTDLHSEVKLASWITSHWL